MAQELPGEDIVRTGLRELAAGQPVLAGFAVLAARPRLERAGVSVPRRVVVEEPSHRLYDALSAEAPDSAHSRHHAIMRRISSYARALEHARGR